MRARIISFYGKLYRHFGPQHWWPAKTHFEVMVGAILTQNTSWLNVEKAISNLKKQKLLEPHKLYKLPPRKLAMLLRPAGYYNVKAKRLRNFLKFLIENYKGSTRKMSLEDCGTLRQKLLSVNGIGPETADSILLYALDKPVFVIDAYTKRILSRHLLASRSLDYGQLQGLFMKHLPKKTRIFNEYHALLVRLGKEFCLKSKPKCQACPLS